MESSPFTFNNTDDAAMGVGFWYIQKFTRGINIETVKICDDPIQIANNDSRIIAIQLNKDSTCLNYYLLVKSKLDVFLFVNWSLGEIPLSPATCLIL